MKRLPLLLLRTWEKTIPGLSDSKVPVLDLQRKLFKKLLLQPPPYILWHLSSKSSCAGVTVIFCSPCPLGWMAWMDC